MKFYSWKDIERFCMQKRDSWAATYDNIEVYPSVITAQRKRGASQTLSEVFGELFPLNYVAESEAIQLDIGDIHIPLCEEESEWPYHREVLPLFKDALYHKSSYRTTVLPELPCPVIAFHSYKGGVGRTLSLLAFAKAWSTVFDASGRQKLLIVDSDIEAPGLTWIQENPREDAFSYLDLLSIIQDNIDVAKMVDLSCSKIGSSTLPIETPRQTIEHLFLPTYRYDEQLLDLYANPSTIVNGHNKEYILAEVLSKIGAVMGAAAVLVDLRAGLSEFSSTLLLDPRVKKYLITSTSKQSVDGTAIVLDFLMKGLEIKEDTILPEVFLSMVPDTIPESEKNEIYSKLLGMYENRHSEGSEDYTDNVFTELPFASELIHLTSLSQILDNLNGRDLLFRIEDLIRNNYQGNPAKEVLAHDVSSREKRLQKIRQTASAQLTAESNSEFELLMTAPLKYLKQQYRDTLPTTVIMGAKGAGKTFLYRKFVEAGNWKSFIRSLTTETLSSEEEGYFLPVFATRNVKEMLDTLTACTRRINNEITSADVEKDVFITNSHKLENRKSVDDWFSFWEALLVSSFNPKLKTFAQMNEMLEKENKKIVILIDGLEETLRNVSKSEDEKKAVRVLCQDIVTVLKSRHPRIGIIVFLRRDMAQDAITVNFAQFRKANEQAELKWSSSDALRLAVWLVSQADKDFYDADISIDVASQEIIDRYLIQLWGMKLGKPSSNEAYSSRWILAALSDFNGQLQARDIIRFLQYAAVPTTKKVPYDDRLLMPADIKDAVQKCSTDKMDEIKDEYATLKPIFEKLSTLPEEQKTLPLKHSEARLSISEEKSMEQEGYLKREGEVYYLPEIVRHALGFRYEKGARPRVLSLLLKR